MISKEFITHGAKNTELALKMIQDGKKFEEVSKEFCGFCGGHLPCGCSNPSPQNTDGSTV